MPAGMQVGGPMKVLLVGNYEFDGSTSMQIWANALLREIRQLGIDVTLISPRPVFGRIKRSAKRFGQMVWLYRPIPDFSAGFARRGGQSECGTCVRSWLRSVHFYVERQAHRRHLPRYACRSRRVGRSSRLSGFLLWATCCSTGSAAGLQRADPGRVRIGVHVERCAPDPEVGAGNLRVVLNGLNYPFQPLDSERSRPAACGPARDPGTVYSSRRLQPSRERTAKAC